MEEEMGIVEREEKTMLIVCVVQVSSETQVSAAADAEYYNCGTFTIDAMRFDPIVR